MNGATLTLGLAGVFAASMAISRRGSRNVRLRVYHGTARVFDDSMGLKQSQAGGNYLGMQVPHDGIWFTESLEEAWRWARGGSDPRVFVADVSLRNPFQSSEEAYANEGISSLPDLVTLQVEGYDGAIVGRAEYDKKDFFGPLVALPTWVVAFDPSQICVISVLRR